MWGFYKKRAIAGGHWEAASEGLMCRKATWVCSQDNFLQGKEAGLNEREAGL